MTTINLNDLIGKTGILCAVDGYRFRIGDLTFEAIEDEGDGYRSCLDHVRIVDNLRPIFHEEVTIYPLEEIDNGIKLVNKLNLSVLEVGTSDYEEYYPCFHFKWEPANLIENKKLDYDTLLNTVTK